MTSTEHPNDPLVQSMRPSSGRRSTTNSNSEAGRHSSCKASSSLEELLYYKGQPSLFYPARLQSAEADLVGVFFPSKLAKTFSMAQMLTGALLVSLGVVAILIRASLSTWGGGVWAGSLVLLTGISGLLASKRPASTPHIVSFLILSLFALASSGLVVVLSATGLATDANAPPAHYVDNEGHRVSFLGEVALSTQAVAINGILVVLSVTASLLSIGCCVLSAREACQCYGTFASSDSSCMHGSDNDMRRDRLLNWLGQQAVVNTFPPGSRPQLVSKSPAGKVAQEKKATRDPTPLQPSPSVSSKSTVPSRLSSYVEGSPVDAAPPPIKIDDKYLAIDKKMAEDYIERLLETDEKRLCATYEVISQEAKPVTSLKRNPKKK